MRTIPYQPLLLRLLHSINTVLVLGCLVTGFLVYDSWDGRWGGLGVTVRDRGLIDIHGTFGFFLFFLFIAFGLYSLTAGRKRLLQKASLRQLQQPGTPAWWVGLQRLTNTTMLLAALLAVATGKLQEENWLPDGNLNETAYFAHLIAWVLVLLSVGLHLLLNAKVGGIPLLVSMVSVQTRADDWLVQKIQQVFAKK